MSQPGPAALRANVVGFGLQERRLGSTILRTYRQTIDIDDVLPNERQPRLGPKEDEELVFRGHPLAATTSGAGTLFYGVWPALILISAFLVRRRFQ